MLSDIHVRLSVQERSVRNRGEELFLHSVIFPKMTQPRYLGVRSLYKRLEVTEGNSFWRTPTA